MMATVFNDHPLNYLSQGQWKLDMDIAMQDRLVRNDKMIAGLALKWFQKTTPARHNLAVHFIE